MQTIVESTTTIKTVKTDVDYTITQHSLDIALLLGSLAQITHNHILSQKIADNALEIASGISPNGILSYFVYFIDSSLSLIELGISLSAFTHANTDVVTMSLQAFKTRLENEYKEKNIALKSRNQELSVPSRLFFYQESTQQNQSPVQQETQITSIIQNKEVSIRDFVYSTDQVQLNHIVSNFPQLHPKAIQRTLKNLCEKNEIQAVGEKRWRYYTKI
jgi:hypothetical protein